VRQIGLGLALAVIVWHPAFGVGKVRYPKLGVWICFWTLFSSGNVLRRWDLNPQGLSTTGF
jgi:hypothetical protein